jgi:choline-glycine betaine transporter
MVATLGTNVGLCTLQLTTGINYISDLGYSPIVMQIAVITLLASVWIIAACTGVHKGIKYISNINMYIFGIILVWAFLFGGTQFILNNTTTAIGKYLAVFIPQAFYLEPAIQSGWIKDWTIFYWAWWLTVAPLTGLFLIRLAKGRTVREFVLVNMFVPIGFIVMWFGTLGSSGIFMQMNGADIWEAITTHGFPVSLFAYLKVLPWKTFFIIMGFAAILFSFITQAESMTYTMAGMTARDKRATEDGEQKSPTGLKIFWGVSIAIMGFVLIQSGGLTAVQTSVVMLGLPVLVLILINAVAFIKSVTNRHIYDLTLTDAERAEIAKEKASLSAGSVDTANAS